MTDSPDFKHVENADNFSRGDHFLKITAAPEIEPLPTATVEDLQKQIAVLKIELAASENDRANLHAQMFSERAQYEHQLTALRTGENVPVKIAPPAPEAPAAPPEAEKPAMEECEPVPPDQRPGYCE
jgi:hypothetical protein